MPSWASVNLLPVKLLYCTLWIGSESELIQLQQFTSPPDFTKYKYVKSTHSAIFAGACVKWWKCNRSHKPPMSPSTMLLNEGIHEMYQWNQLRWPKIEEFSIFRWWIHIQLVGVTISQWLLFCTMYNAFKWRLHVAVKSTRMPCSVRFQ